jgi:arylsulfatase A-like enzyme
MLEVVDGESIVPLFSGTTPQRTRPIFFGNKGMAVIDGQFKLVRNGNGKGTPWELFDLEKDPEEAADLAAQLPDRLEEMKAKALEIEASIDASELGEDYPEGKVLQPQRSEKWEEMPEYRKLFPTFQKLKPTWEPPSGSKK